MESISIYDGLMLTIVSMLVVFSVLAAIWGLVELVARFIPEADSTTQSSGSQGVSTPAATQHSNTLAPNPKHQQVAELMALILASEDQPDKKFEITESKRVK